MQVSSSCTKQPSGVPTLVALINRLQALIDDALRENPKPHLEIQSLILQIKSVLRQDNELREKHLGEQGLRLSFLESSPSVKAEEGSARVVRSPLLTSHFIDSNIGRENNKILEQFSFKPVQAKPETDLRNQNFVVSSKERSLEGLTDDSFLSPTLPLPSESAEEKSKDEMHKKIMRAVRRATKIDTRPQSFGFLTELYSTKFFTKFLSEEKNKAATERFFEAMRAKENRRKIFGRKNEWSDVLIVKALEVTRNTIDRFNSF